MSLLNDVCRCHASQCPVREACARWCQITRDRERSWPVNRSQPVNSRDLNPERLNPCPSYKKERA